MIKQFKRIIAAFCGLAFLGAGVQAATVIDYDTDTRTMEIRGASESEDSLFVTFSIMPAGIRPEDVNAGGELENMLYRTVEVAEDGTFAQTIVLPETFANGQYVVRTYQDKLTGTNLFGFLSAAVPADVLQSVNSADRGNMKEALLALNSFGFDPAVLAKHGARIADYVYQNRPAAGYDGKGLMAAYYMGEALARQAAGEISLKELLLLYSAYIPIDYETEYASLPESVRTELEALFAQGGGEQDFQSRFYDKRYTAQMKCAASFEILRDLYLDYAAQHGVSVADYNSLPSAYLQDQVFIKMLSKLGSASDMGDVNDQFRSAVASVKDGGGGKNPGGGKGSGGGGGGGNLATLVPPTVPDTAGGTEEPATGVFSDTAGHWAEDYIARMKEHGAVNGLPDGSFLPDASVTRAEFVKMLGGLLGVEEQSGSQFEDVTAMDWYFGAVYGAWNRKLVQGTSETQFSPEAQITREDAAVMIWRAWPTDQAGGSEFADRGQISDYAVKAIDALTFVGILTGYEDQTIRPQTALSRGEAAAILSRSYDLFGSEKR